MAESENVIMHSSTVLLCSLFVQVAHAASLNWPWSWDEPVHTLTWGTSSWTNCSGLTPPGTPGFRPNCMDSERILDILIKRDIVYVQGYDFGRELQQDNFENAEREIAAIREHKREKGSKKPYGILGLTALLLLGFRLFFCFTTYLP
eukprot:m.60371 g.60371  ORF g.60371 m.60371 type:complete len:147 (+) comp11314_c0_seq1:88-528(+)